MQEKFRSTRRNFLQRPMDIGRGVLASYAGFRLADWSEKIVALADELSPDKQKKIEVEKVETIFSDGNHNAFTSIATWRGSYYVAFRSANTHATPWDEGWEDLDVKRGHITLAQSTDLRHWSTTVVLNTPHDDRDPKILVTGDRLYVYSASIIGPGDRTPAQESYMVFTEDGQHWTKPVSAYRYNYGFWKPKTYQGTHYVAADIDVTLPGGKRTMQVELLSSPDGQLWQPVSLVTRGGKRTETALVFLEDGSLLAIVRQNILLVAPPPYTEWSEVGPLSGERYQFMPIGIHGPAAERMGSTIVVVCRGRKQDFPDDQPGQYRTSLFTLNRETMSLDWHYNLPTEWGGDVSYAGILPLDDKRLLVSYYDGELYEKGVFKRSDIKLAQLVVK